MAMGSLLKLHNYVMPVLQYQSEALKACKLQKTYINGPQAFQFCNLPLLGADIKPTSLTMEQGEHHKGKRELKPT
jgi:hypothetical protein